MKKKTSVPATQEIEQLKQRIADWHKQSPEAIAEAAELGYTKESCERALKVYEQTQLAQESKSNRTTIARDSDYESKWTDMRDYIMEVVTDLKRGTRLVPELQELVDYFTKSMKNIDANSHDNEVLKTLKAQLMCQLYNISLNRFLDKQDKKKTVDSEELASDKPAIDGEATKSEKLTEHENTRARYTVAVFEEKDIQRCEDMLFALGFDPEDFRTEAGKAVVGRFAFRNNLGYAKAGDPLARKLTKEVIAEFKAFQQEHYLAWAGACATGDSRQKNINFYMGLIKLWEARALYNKQDFEGAEAAAEQVAKYSPNQNLMNEVKGLLKAVRRGPEPTAKENMAMFA